ncbi:chaperonin CPN60-like 1, mitochondrial isoform X1 [Raphanus sativus]|uniref:Chaperonin CPN60-like 1, mitochondrial isoform X1 n=1 Tax=Raphanus sativus TaxID=3726 RepID=A0A9W3DLN1_RAPSA|nr:chaperonin CPN60-like 1, mitochondrial isoform X1 [Raphanus sativus]
MYRLVSNIASKSRNARKCTTQIGSRLSSTRSYSAKDKRSGVNKELSDTGQVTMGPKQCRAKGCNVTIEQSSEGNITITHSWRRRAPKVTKDDVTVAKSIESKDRVDKKVFASPVKPVSKATNNVAVYGTTYATVLTRAILTEACKSIASWTNERELTRGIKLAVGTVLKNLKCRARMIRTFEEIAQVGTTSANGDKEIGELIAKAIESVGKEGVITVQAGNTWSNELEVVEGMKIDRGYRSPLFITNKKNQTCELEDPLILIHEKEITSPDPMSKVTGPDSISTVLELALQKLEYPLRHYFNKAKVTKFEYMTKVLDLALKKKRSLLIIAEDLDSFSVGGLIWKTPRSRDVTRQGLSWETPSGEMKLCAVKAPGFGENRRAYMHDLATLTGAQVITEDRGMSLEKIELSMLGNCKKVIVSKDSTVFIGGAGDKKHIGERCEQIRSMVEASESDYDKGMLQDRLDKLSGRVAVIKIGGSSEREVKIDRVTDALNATKAALEEGIVPGGGVALLYASKELEKLSTDDDSDQNLGVQIIQNALKTPVYTIASNAGVDGEAIVNELLESDNPDLGYDAVKGEYVDMVKSGIIDPVKMIRTALVDAARNADVSSLCRQRWKQLGLRFY